MNCLHIAALYENLRLREKLLRNHNFDIHTTDNSGWTALHFSSRHDGYELVKYFVDKGMDIFLKTNGGLNCLHIAALYENLRLCEKLLINHNFDIHTTDNSGWTALHFSSLNGSYELVKYFVEKGTDIFLKTNDGRNCLHIGAEHGHLSLCKKLIKKHNFDIHLANNAGWTALHFSSENVSYELIKYCIDRGTDIFLKTNLGNNCLHIAAICGHLNLCKTLIDKHGFDVHVANNDGWTILHCSAENGSFDLFSYILEKGENFKKMYCKTNCMKNSLHLSARNGHIDICQYILEYFVKDYKDNNTRNKYALAVGSYKNHLFYKYNKIFLHEKDIDGNTYMHLAAEKNQTKICMLLLRYDAEIINLVNKKDKTARDLAKDNGHEDALNALEVEYNRTGMLLFIFLFRLHLLVNFAA